MNFAAVLRSLRRRWYILVPGILIAISAAAVAWTTIPPDYERAATQLLLPGEGTLPEGSSNPFLFLGGLTAAADVIVRAVGSEDTVRELTEPHPGSEIAVSRDPLNAGPAIRITVTAQQDEVAAEILDDAIEMTVRTVDELQTSQGIPASSQIGVTLVTRDGVSTLRQRNRLTVVAALGLGISALTVLLAAVADGLARGRRRRRHRSDHPAAAVPERRRRRVEDDESPPRGDADDAPPHSDSDRGRSGRRDLVPVHDSET